VRLGSGRPNPCGTGGEQLLVRPRQDCRLDRSTYDRDVPRPEGVVNRPWEQLYEKTSLEEMAWRSGDERCKTCGAEAGCNWVPRLIARDEVSLYLNLNAEQVDWLIRTRQLTVLRMRGEERFDRHDIDLMVETYKKISTRRA
jgi:hypothetical protein